MVQFRLSEIKLDFYFGISEMNDPLPDALAPMGAQSSP
jgi:hypothetical protein